jgi:hypothetical protein
MALASRGSPERRESNPAREAWREWSDLRDGSWATPTWALFECSRNLHKPKIGVKPETIPCQRAMTGVER